jgi:hypothetical protein
LTQQVHWLDFNKGILLLEMHGTNIKKSVQLYSHKQMPDDGQEIGRNM